MSIEPFKIAVPDGQLAELRARIGATRWTDAVEGAGWTYGVEPHWLRDMLAYWADGFDWRAQEAEMNRFAHYRCEIDGVPIHYMHVPGKARDARPLILSHGWPWTFWEWKDVIPSLGDFELIIPSLPGFGFSSPLTAGGFDHKRIAKVWLELMSRLGHPHFGAVGGDAGALITGALGRLAPDRVSGIYLTTPLPFSLRGWPADQRPFAEDEAWMAAQAIASAPKIQSHLHAHMHDSQTLAYALNDSPAGLAAWLWQRRYSWSDLSGSVAGDPADIFGRDFLCTNASIYWFTGTIGSSMRMYHDNFAETRPKASPGGRYLRVPTAIAIAPKDIVMLPRAVAEREVDLRRWTVLPRGGHFGPAEVPELIGPEIASFFASLG